MNKDVTKKELVRALHDVVKMTRAGADVETMELTEDSEYVLITHTDGSKQKVDVSADSGISLIRDVCKEIA